MPIKPAHVWESPTGHGGKGAFDATTAAGDEEEADDDEEGDGRAVAVGELTGVTEGEDAGVNDGRGKDEAAWTGLIVGAPVGDASGARGNPALLGVSD